MLVSGRNVQNSPLVSLVSEVSVSHQFLHCYPGSQKHQILIISHAYFPLSDASISLKAKGNPLPIPGNGAECFLFPGSA